MVSAFLLCVSFEVMGFCGGFGGKLYSRRLTPCGRGLMAPPGLTALGAKGSVRDRLTPPGRVEGSALGRYIVSLRWRGGRPLGRQYKCRLWRRKPDNRSAGVGNAFPLWWLAPPPFRPAGKRVTGFSVAYGSLRIQFPCHRKRGHYGCLAMELCLCRKA